MSKAFTKETDAEPIEAEPSSPDKLLPPGSKNYMTPAGEKRLRDELRDLLQRLRPEVTAVVSWAASNGDRSENADYIYGKKRLREIDRRIRFLTKRLEGAEVVDPRSVQSDRVRFGATVVVRDEEDVEKTYRIVGIDEIDAKSGKISWISPLGKAILNKKVGDFVSFQSPKGEIELEILALKYEEIL